LPKYGKPHGLSCMSERAIFLLFALFLLMQDDV
jgi:hypothetical protein